MHTKMPNMLLEHENYRGFLKALLAEKVQKNRAFSLRAMAVQLGIQSSQLSEVMSGKANFSQATALKVAAKIGLKTDETEYFCMMVQYEAETDCTSKDLVLQRLNRFRKTKVKRPVHDLSIDSFKKISDWYHSAIMEMTDLEGFECTAESIAQTLKISRLEAQVGLERLERLKILSRNAQGKWTRLSEDVQIRSAVPSLAMRSFYRQMLNKAADSLETQTPDERLSGYETLTLDAESLEEARKAYNKFLDTMAKISKRSKKKTDVYHVLVHCFNLTPNRKRSSA